MIKVMLVGSHLNYNIEHFAKICLNNLGIETQFFGYKDTSKYATPAFRMMITRSPIARALAKPFLLSKINEKLKNECAKMKPDLMLSIKGETVLPSTIEWLRNELGVKTVLWYPDDPRFFDSFVKHVAPHYEYIFTSSEKAIKMYREIGVERVDFLPFACEPSVHKRVQLSEEEKRGLSCDICFVGTPYLRRSRIISKLDKFDVRIYGPHWHFLLRRGKVYGGVWGPDMVKVFNASKIVLNIHIESDLEYKSNMRVFEATGSGSFQLTDKPFGIEKLFLPRKELVCYEDTRELIELAAYYLDPAAEEERIEIGIMGQTRAYREHTYENRIKQMLDKIGLHVHSHKDNVGEK